MKRLSAGALVVFMLLFVFGSVNAMAAERMFAENLRDWEEAINFYLATGKKLAHHDR